MLDEVVLLLGNVLVHKTSLGLEAETNRGLELDVAFPMVLTMTVWNKVTHTPFEGRYSIVGGEESVVFCLLLYAGEDVDSPTTTPTTAGKCGCSSRTTPNNIHGVPKLG